MSLGAAIRAALEALDVGDQALATNILLDALEDHPRPLGVRCPDCRRRFDWPGLLDAHRIHCTARAAA